MVSWVSLVQSKPKVVLRVLIAVTLLFALTAALNLGINSNNLDLLSPKLESRIYQAEFAALFPDLENALLVVVDGASPEAARSAAVALLERLNNMPNQVESAYFPNGGEFFDQHGLLYMQFDELQEFAQQIKQLRPFIISLEHKPNLVGFSELVVRNMRATRFNFDYEELWEPMLDRLTLATTNALGNSVDQRVDASLNAPILAGLNLADETTRQVIVVNPILEFGSIMAANRSIASVRTAANELGLDQKHGIRVRITGNPALNLEEMIGIAWDIGVAGIFCFALVIVVLVFALRSLPLVIASVVTLLIGLIWTAGLASLMVGHLNIVSLSVAILFIGLGVDFAIHLGMSYADSLRAGLSEQDAMQEAVKKIGGSLFICTISTAIGFLVFVPTPYLGVAELGLIAGTGMLVIFFLTVTLFPALLVSWLHFDSKKHIKYGLRFETNLGKSIQRHFRSILWVALALLIAALIIAPKAHFDPNVIDMRDPGTESVQTFNELLDESGLASPWYIDAIAPDQATAQRWVEQAEQLSTVEQAISVANFVPKEQARKLHVLNDLLKQFAALEEHNDAIDPTVLEQLKSLARLREFLSQDVSKSDTETFANKERKLVAVLQQLQSKIADERLATGESSVTLTALDNSLIGEFPAQVGRLRKALSPTLITREVLPASLRKRMVASNGEHRVQIFPKENLRNEASLLSFVASIQAIAPRATGIAVNLVAFEQATKHSFKQALGLALLLITLLLIYLWRNLMEVFLVLGPLILSLALAVSCMALLNLPFNFVNVIVIPLMFGIGVDSGIHLVQRSQSKLLVDRNLLNTTTARAVYYSALTTLISFGSLSLSSHRGMSSLGTLLAIGMVLTVLCNLVVLPALLEWKSRDWKWKR